jgi:hypothetical protein
MMSVDGLRATPVVPYLIVGVKSKKLYQSLKSNPNAIHSPYCPPSDPFSHRWREIEKEASVALLRSYPAC